MCKPPVAPLRQSHKTQIFFITVLTISLAIQFLIVLPSKCHRYIDVSFRLENHRYCVHNNWIDPNSADSFPCRFGQGPWVPEARSKLHGFTCKHPFVRDVSRLWGAPNAKVPPLRHMQPLRGEVWPPLPLHQQLCRHLQSQRLPSVHTVTRSSDHLGNHFQHNSPGRPLQEQRADQLPAGRVLLLGPVSKLDYRTRGKHLAIGILAVLRTAICRILKHDHSQEFLQWQDNLRDVLQESPLAFCCLAVWFDGNSKLAGSSEYCRGHKSNDRVQVSNKSKTTL